MLKVTKAALDRLSEKLENKKASEEAALRFTRKPGGWRLQVDEPDPTDNAFTRGGRKILVLDNEVSQSLSNKTLDVRETGDGPRLTLLVGGSNE